jgi:hypothetical protein
MNEEEKKYYEFSFIIELGKEQADYLLARLEQLIKERYDKEFVGGYVTADEEVQDEEKA